MQSRTSLGQPIMFVRPLTDQFVLVSLWLAPKHASCLFEDVAGGSVQIRVRDARASYMQSLAVLREAKACGVYTKSSIMLGLGESDDEIIDTMLDLRDAGEIGHLRPLFAAARLYWQADMRWQCYGGSFPHMRKPRWCFLLLL